ncbi:vWA domain-containing protein [Shinella zoogloeoides]
MKKMTEKRSLLARLRDDRRGNFAMMTAFALPVILGAGGFAMDLTNMVLTKAELQDAVDSASLAAASALSNDKKTVAEAKEIALKFFKTQLSGTLPGKSDLTSATTIDITETTEASGGKTFKINVATGYELQLNPLTRLFGQTSKQIVASGSAESGTESKNALSMYFVLDRSGSMGEQTNSTTTYACPTKKDPNKTCTTKLTRIASLQLATQDLLKQLDTADPKAIFVRTGAVSYNSSAQSPTDLAWGTAGVLKYVNALTASGNTNSAPAFTTAYNSLTSGTEETEHKNKAGNGQVPSKYIIFMTDGDNNIASADTDTKTECDKAKANNIEVYTIAFMAPSRGQALLQYCATTTNHYFAAESTADLLAAFKTIGQQASQVIARVTK